MKRIALPAALLSAFVLSGCVIDAGSDGWEENSSLAERTRLAIEACGQGNVAKVTSTGYTCKTFDEGAVRRD
ncbi:hypothetical protein [Parvularcula maris]|uniref:Uncharacterized protein n=1 Tax=Parvularcula maris TaxID=2965077 RepID=A0A9X2LA26_9PROT|nr:hypothetical protein [Parvularcula maris]MCQ8185679.1 hypothetical protein [Parvularcula maris]